MAELRGAAATAGWQDGHHPLAEAGASLLGARAQAAERRVRLAAIGVLGAIDLTAHAGALHHVAAAGAHGPAAGRGRHRAMSSQSVARGPGKRREGAKGGARVPEAPSGSLRLNGHVAGTTEARGTAGSRDG